MCSATSNWKRQEKFPDKLRGFVIFTILGLNGLLFSRLVKEVKNRKRVLNFLKYLSKRSFMQWIFAPLILWMQKIYVYRKRRNVGDLYIQKTHIHLIRHLPDSIKKLRINAKIRCIWFHAELLENFGGRVFEKCAKNFVYRREISFF